MCIQDRPLLHRPHLFRFSFKVASLNNKTKERDRLGVKLTFLGFHIQFVLQESGEHLLNMTFMSLCRVGENLNVIQTDKNKLVKEVPEDIINESLEDSWSIGEPKRYN